MQAVIGRIKADNMSTDENAPAVISVEANRAIDEMNSNFPEAKTRHSGKLLTRMRYEVGKYGTSWAACKLVLGLAEEKLNAGD